MLPIFYDIKKDKAFTSQSLKGQEVHVDSVVRIGRNLYRIVSIARAQSISDSTNFAALLLSVGRYLPSKYLIIFVIDETPKKSIV